MGIEFKKLIIKSLRNDQVIVIPIAIVLLLLLFHFPRAGFRVLKFMSLMMAGLLFLVVAIVIIAMYIVPRFQKRKWRGRAEPDSEEFREWLMGQIRDLRAIGFFQADRMLSDQELFDKVLAEMVEREGNDLTACRVAPCLIAALDQDRVYYEDTEDDRYLNDDGWVEIVQDVARISRGAFKPENIEAKCDYDKKSAEVLFDQNGRRHSLKFKLDGDWMDPALFDQFNPFVSDAGYQYAAEFSDHGQWCFVVAVKDEERKILKKMGWNI
ncbi:hypothetical protein LLG95_00140 [bacterium]|nr:hypothetical protein [bacterium]